VTKLAVALGFLALNLYTYHYMARDAVIPVRDSFASFPLRVGDWECAGSLVLDPAVERNLGATDYLICDYRRSSLAEQVSVYVGYHERQIREEGGGADENSIHPPAHCLPGSGWDIIASETVPLAVPGLPESGAPVKRLTIARGEARQLVYYWYQSRGRVIAEDWQKIVYVGWDRATRGRTDGSLVRFTVPIVRGDEDRAVRAFEDLAGHILPLLEKHVPN
jgi:EpsI family protein